ncbi:unnamed protein product [Effrenium voratum]|uniref:Uncharacterized protein n=1 Tax=Effrenium voratum TaxID=2562239 RepID=A0AA36MNM5_9DINO|nr:unnamed protein product [Effrenium voratum]
MFRTPCTPWASQLRAPFSRCSVGVALGQRTGDSSGLPHLPVKTLGRLLAQPGALNSVDFERAVGYAMAKVEDMDGKDCIRVLGALSESATRPELPQLRALGAQLSERLEDISNSDLAALASNLARVSQPVAPVFARLSGAFGRRVSAANPKQLTEVASAFARARLADRRLFPRMAQAAVRQLHLFGPKDLSAFVSSFAALGLCHEPLLAAGAPLLASLGPRLDALDLALVAFGYAQFFLVFPPVVAMLSQRLPARASELPPERLAELAVSCGRLQVAPKELLALWARQLELRDLSPELFGQVSKSLSLLGLASSPRIQALLAAECRARLKDLAPDPVEGAWWVLDLLECLGLAAEDARAKHGGLVVDFWVLALDALLPALAGVVESLSPEELATCYRSLRQLPPSLAASAESASIRGAVHRGLALRSMGLVAVEAFDYVFLTSVVYSQLCLYPELCGSNAKDAEPESEVWSMISSSFSSGYARWRELSPGDIDVHTEFQVAALSLLETEPSDVRVETRLSASNLRPVAMELQELLGELGQSCRQCWVGPFETLQAESTGFCLMPETAYFRSGGEALELCAERAAEVQLVRRHRRTEVLSFAAWRRMGKAARRAWLEQRLPEKRAEHREKALENLARAQEIFQDKDNQLQACQARYTQVMKALNEKRAKRDHLKDQACATR